MFDQHDGVGDPGAEPPVDKDAALAFGGPIVVFDGITLSFDDKVILREVSFTLQTGKASGNTVTVLGTGVTTNIVGHALATVNIGNGGGLAGISGTLNIENTTNLTNVNIDDSTDTAGRTATFTDMGANPSDFEHNGNHWGQLRWHLTRAALASRIMVGFPDARPQL